MHLAMKDDINLFKVGPESKPPLLMNYKEGSVVLAVLHSTRDGINIFSLSFQTENPHFDFTLFLCV